jgi:hypothetical protein
MGVAVALGEGGIALGWGGLRVPVISATPGPKGLKKGDSGRPTPGVEVAVGVEVGLGVGVKSQL